MGSGSSKKSAAKTTDSKPVDNKPAAVTTDSQPAAQPAQPNNTMAQQPATQDQHQQQAGSPERADHRRRDDYRNDDEYDRQRGRNDSRQRERRFDDIDDDYERSEKPARNRFDTRQRDSDHAVHEDRDRNRHEDPDKTQHTKKLKSIGDILFSTPPDPVYDSKTYSASVDVYEIRLQGARNEKELRHLYDREMNLLLHQTVEDHVRAKDARHGDATRQTQESEYRLKASALINCFKTKNRVYELITQQRDQEKLEDIAFLESLRKQIEQNNLPRADVLRQMEEYNNYCRNQRALNGGTGKPTPTVSADQHHRLQNQQPADDSSNAYTTRPPLPPAQGVQPPPPLAPPAAGPQNGGGGGAGSGRPLPAGVQQQRVKDEAARVMASSERSTQRAVDVRKADRDRIGREVSSRASSLNSSNLPPR